MFVMGGWLCTPLSRLQARSAHPTRFLFVLQEQRDIVIVASGARGLGSVKPVLDWPPVQAHAGVKKVHRGLGRTVVAWVG